MRPLRGRDPAQAGRPGPLYVHSGDRAWHPFRAEPDSRRVAAAEPDNCATDPNTAIISPIPTHAQIASFISTHREAITRELNDLARAGLIEKHTGKLVIRDVAELMRMLSEVVGETHFHAQAGE